MASIFRDETYQKKNFYHQLSQSPFDLLNGLGTLNTGVMNLTPNLAAKITMVNLHGLSAFMPPVLAAVMIIKWKKAVALHRAYNRQQVDKNEIETIKNFVPLTEEQIKAFNEQEKIQSKIATLISERNIKKLGHAEQAKIDLQLFLLENKDAIDVLLAYAEAVLDTLAFIAITTLNALMLSAAYAGLLGAASIAAGVVIPVFVWTSIFFFAKGLYHTLVGEKAKAIESFVISAATAVMSVAFSFLLILGSQPVFHAIAAGIIVTVALLATMASIHAGVQLYKSGKLEEFKKDVGEKAQQFKGKLQTYKQGVGTLFASAKGSTAWDPFNPKDVKAVSL